jgi:hypothetical protein
LCTEAVFQRVRGVRKCAFRILWWLAKIHRIEVFTGRTGRTETVEITLTLQFVFSIKIC